MNRGVFLFIVIAFVVFFAFTSYLNNFSKEIEEKSVSKYLKAFEPVKNKGIFLQPVESPPNPPSGLVATVLSNDSIHLSWVDQSNDEEGFVLEYKLTSDTMWSTINLGQDTITYVHLSLNAGTSYDYRVYAFNSFGNSAYSGPVSQQTFPNPVISSLSPSPIYTNNTDPIFVSGSGFVPQFGMLAKLSSDAEWSILCVAGDGSCKYTSSNLIEFTVEPPITGDYDLMYVNIAGASPVYSNIFQFSITVSPPRVPVGLTATPISSSQMRLNWMDNSHNELGFNLEYKQSSSSTWQTITPPIGQNTITFLQSSLAPSTSYDYRINSFNAEGSSIYSNVVSGTTLSPSSCDTFIDQPTCEQNSCSWCLSCSGSQSNGIGVDRCVPLGGCTSQYSCVLNQCGATCEQNSQCSSSQSCSSVSCGCTEQDPSITNIIPSSMQWSLDGTSILISGDYFANDADVLVNNVLIANNRINRGIGTLSFVRNAGEFNVGANQIVVRNPVSTRQSVPSTLTLTSSPTITSLNPDNVLYTVSTLVQITGSDFDPYSRVYFDGIVDLSGLGLTTYRNSNLIEVLIPQLDYNYVGDHQLTVRNGDGSSTSNPSILRINHPFDYNFFAEGSSLNMKPSETLSTFAIVQTLHQMTQESINVTFDTSNGITVSLNGLDNCLVDVSAQIPNCRIYFNITTSNLAIGQYNITLNATSEDTLVRHQTTIAINISNSFCGDNTCDASTGETCSTCSADCGACSSGSSGGGGGGGGSGGGGPRILPQCSDKKDNDNDGKVDYPADPGCTNSTDLSETDSSDLVKSNFTLDDDSGEELPAEEKDIQIRVVFWIVFITLIVGITLVSITILKTMVERKNLDLLRNSPINSPIRH